MCKITGWELSEYERWEECQCGYVEAATGNVVETKSEGRVGPGVLGFMGHRKRFGVCLKSNGQLLEVRLRGWNSSVESI